MKFGLKDETINKINNIFIKYPEVEKVVLYGSRAKGNYKNGSDIDLTLFGVTLDLSICYRIEDEIDDLLLPYTFDISIYHQISNENLIEHIDRVGVVFYEKKCCDS